MWFFTIRLSLFLLFDGEVAKKEKSRFSRPVAPNPSKARVLIILGVQP